MNISEYKAGERSLKFYEYYHRLFNVFFNYIEKDKIDSLSKAGYLYYNLCYIKMNL